MPILPALKILPRDVQGGESAITLDLQQVLIQVTRMEELQIFHLVGPFEHIRYWVLVKLKPDIPTMVHYLSTTLHTFLCPQRSSESSKPTLSAPHRSSYPLFVIFFCCLF